MELFAPKKMHFILMNCNKSYNKNEKKKKKKFEEKQKCHVKRTGVIPALQAIWLRKKLPYYTMHTL